MPPNAVVAWTSTCAGLHLLRDKVRDDRAQLRILLEASRAHHGDIVLTDTFAQRLLAHVEGYQDLLEVTARRVQHGGPTLFRGEA